MMYIQQMVRFIGQMVPRLNMLLTRNPGHCTIEIIGIMDQQNNNSVFVPGGFTEYALNDRTKCVYQFCRIYQQWAIP